MFNIFHRPLVVTIGKPNVWQILWAILTIVFMGNLIFAGFAGQQTARMYTEIFGGNVHDMYLILKGVTYGSILMLLVIAFGSNQVSVPISMIENHRPTAVIVGFGLFVVGVVLNWPAVLAFINKFDLLWALLSLAGLVLIIGAIFWGTNILKRRSTARA